VAQRCRIVACPLGFDDGIGVSQADTNGGAGRAGDGVIGLCAVVPLDASALVARCSNQTVLFAAVYVKYDTTLVALANLKHGRRGDGALEGHLGNAQLLAVGDAAGVGADQAGFAEHPASAGLVVEHQLRPAVFSSGLVNYDLKTGVARVGAGAAGVADGIALGVDVVGRVDGTARTGDLHPQFVCASFGGCPGDGFAAAADQFDGLGVADGVGLTLVPVGVAGVAATAAVRLKTTSNRAAARWLMGFIRAVFCFITSLNGVA